MARTTAAGSRQQQQDEGTAADLDGPPDNLPGAPGEDLDLDPANIPEALQFSTRDKDTPRREEDPGTPFTLDGSTFVAYRPKDAVMVILLSAMSAGATAADKVSAIMTWLDHCLSPLSQIQLKNRMMDRDDDLDWEDLADVMVRLLDYWDSQDVPVEDNRAARRAAARAPAPTTAAAARRTAARARR